jgi:tetratricopeptide (TPR) repeat protein
MRRLRRELRAFDGLDGPQAHQARSTLLRRYAISRASQGRIEEAIACGREAVTEAESSADPETMGTAYANLHLMYLMAGRDSDRPLGDLALRSYVAVDDLAGQAQSSNNLAIEAHRDNRWVEAADMFGRAADLYRRIGDTDNGGIATCNRAEVLVNQGRFDEAAPLLDDALETARSVADDELVAMVLREQGRLRSRSGDPEGGLRLLEEARDLFETIDAPDEVMLTNLAIAETALLGGDPEEALQQTTELIDAEATSDLGAELRALHGFALLRTGRGAEAEEEFRRGAAADVSAANSFGYALNCLGLSRTGAEDAPVWGERGTTALHELGVVALPLLDGVPA